jgi:glycerol-3-phosphate acyltransferase PlsX
VRIAVDIMGSDADPLALCEGVREAAKTYPNILVLATHTLVDRVKEALPGVDVYSVDEEITMDDSPLYAVRKKKDSSLLIGLHLLRSGTVGALVTAGNTGALIAGASMVLPLLPGCDRPALLAELPTHKGVYQPQVEISHSIRADRDGDFEHLSEGNIQETISEDKCSKDAREMGQGNRKCQLEAGITAVLDAGASVEASADQLIQYAYMGIAHMRRYYGLTLPRVGLLNIGEEWFKGRPTLREAFDRMNRESKESKEWHFVGNVESTHLFDGVVDVVVTDGFTGNVFLKTSEGVLNYLLSKLGQSHAQVDLSKLKEELNFSSFSSARLCGVEGVVIKCHGDASANTIACGIAHAAKQ